MPDPARISGWALAFAAGQADCSDLPDIGLFRDFIFANPTAPETTGPEHWSQA